MKVVLSMLSMLTFPALVSAQRNVQYTYDNAGNRTSQSRVYEIDRQLSPLGQADNRLNAGTAICSQVSGHIVRAAMQSGILRVEVLGLKSDDRCRMAVYSMGGQVLLSKETTDTQNTFDLTGFATGIYMLQIVINDDKDTWKLLNN
ncbi:MAG: T9SS type A sorting domain-containing protein [Prevotella sp.]|nr:T9SS type A sorting domain-containing protein [Prevotella sp.]